MIGSTAPNGSSISRTGGSAARARATPDALLLAAGELARIAAVEFAGVQADQVEHLLDPVLAPCDLDQPIIFGTRAMFCATVMCGKRPEDWMA